MGNHRQRPSLGSLYEFWGSALADALFEEDPFILNLASKEYSKCISRYLRQDIRFITCVFAELIGDKVVEKGTLAKMARGEWSRYLAGPGRRHGRNQGIQPVGLPFFTEIF